MYALLERRDVRLTLVYAAAAMLWIVLSDTLMNFIAGGNETQILMIRLVNGAGFVAVTSVTLLVILRREIRKQSRAEHVSGDIPDNKPLEAVKHEREARYQLMVEVASEGIQFIDANARITYVNPRMCGMNGFQPEEVIGHEYFEYIHPSSVESARQRFEQRKLGVRGTRDVMIQHKNGSYIWVHVSAAPVFGSDGTFQGTLTMYTDITEAKNYEQVLEKALRHEKELNELKTRIVKTISHEFRTPLSIIMASCELLRYYRGKMDENKINEKLKTIGDQVKHLTGTIKDVLDVEQAQSGKLEFKPESVDFDTLCREVIGEFQNISGVTHQFHYSSDHVPVVIKLDDELIGQVIKNLISNAIKYSPLSNEVFIRLQHSANSAVLSVTDKGIGIPAADIKDLFEIFHRASNVGTIPGLGLGLSLSKQIVEMHGGSITVESELDIGTTFTITIPITPANR